MKKQTKTYPRLWISLAFSVLITLLTLKAARNGAEHSLSTWLGVAQFTITNADKAVRAWRQKQRFTSETTSAA